MERTDYVYRSNGEKVVAGSKTAPGGTNGATFTAVDGSKVDTENGPQTVTAHTALMVIIQEVKLQLMMLYQD